MPHLALQPDGANGYVWITLDGRTLVPLREDDGEGLKVVTTALVTSGVVDAEEPAAIQGLTVRTVEAHAAMYAETGNSADLIDRRQFNSGQQTDYRMEPHKPALVRQAVLNVVQGQENTERGLAAQLDDAVDDRTVGRHLHAMG